MEQYNLNNFALSLDMVESLVKGKDDVDKVNFLLLYSASMMEFLVKNNMTDSFLEHHNDVCLKLHMVAEH